MRITLVSNSMRMEIDPDAGATVSSLRHGMLDILRPRLGGEEGVKDPLDSAGFAMVPFVGRIHRGHVDWNGHNLSLPANLPPEPHAIHGHGWKSAWDVDQRTPDSATLSYRHKPDAWPWSYLAEQKFQLSPNGLELKLSVTNLSTMIMPAGLGWHPYFRRAEAQLSLATTHEWHPDLDGHDNSPMPMLAGRDLTLGNPVQSLDLDTTFSVKHQTAIMTWPTHRVKMLSDPLFSHATVYVPPGEDFFCVEPVSHAPNAINSQRAAAITGFRTLAPGETLSGKIRLLVEF